MADFSALVGEVQVGKDRYAQSITFDKAKPYLLIFKITETDSKGRTDSDTYEWNLAHAEPNLIKWDDGRDQILVVIDLGRKDYVKKFDEGELEDYDDEVQLLASDIDNAREIVELIKAAIPLAVAEWEADTAFPQDYPGLKKWLAARIKKATTSDDTYLQSWTFFADHPNRATFKQAEEDEQDEEVECVLNVADLDPKKIDVNIRGDMVLLELACLDNNRFIQITEGGEPGNYDNSLTVVFEEVDEAIIAGRAFEKLMAMAVEAQKEYYASVSSPEAALSGLKKALVKFKHGEESYSPELNGDCLAELTYLVTDDGESTEYKYRYNWADLDTAKVE
ncbi:MAG: hypothetical protein GYB31_20695, partial [Bacteroidetes bacterium]|nr:hypothetical protein [Bacteroidota bacterium]